MKARIIKTDIAGIQIGCEGIVEYQEDGFAAIKVPYTKYNGETIESTYWFSSTEFELILDTRHEFIKIDTPTYPGGSTLLGFSEVQEELDRTNSADPIQDTVNIPRQKWVQAILTLQSLQNQINIVNEILHGPQNSR